VVFVVVTAIVAVTGAAVIVTATGVGTMKLSYWMTSWSMCGEHFVGTVVTMNCWTRDVAVLCKKKKTLIHKKMVKFCC
jgi:hypothetical protein